MFVKPVSPIPNMFIKIIVSSTIILVNVLSIILGSPIGNPLNGYHIILDNILTHQFTNILVIYILMLITSILIVLFGVFSKRYGSLMGFTRSFIVLSGYLSLIVVLGVLVEGIILTNIEYVVKAILWSIIALTLDIVLVKIPKSTFSIYKLADDKLIPIENEEHIELYSNDRLVIRVYGNIEDLAIEYEPRNIFDLDYVLVKSNYTDLILTPLYEGNASIYISDAGSDLVYKVLKTTIAGLQKRKLKIKIFINNNVVDEREVDIEVNKKLEHVIKGLVDSILKRYGISSERVKDVVITDASGTTYLEDTRIDSIKPVDNEIRVVIIVEEEFRDILKELGTADINKLWEILMKRLEILRSRLKDLSKEIDSVLERITSSLKNYGEIK